MFFYALALLILGAEIYLVSGKSAFVFSRELFVQSAIVCYLLYVFLEYGIRLVLDKRYVPLFCILPALLLFFLFQNVGSVIILSYAAILTVLIRLVFCFLPKQKEVLLFGCFVLDIVALFLRFGRHSFLGDYRTDKLLFLSLVILSLVSLQQFVCEKKLGAFPFHFFLVMALFLVLIPVKKTPIDWSHVEHFFEQAAEKTYDTFYTVNGLFKSDTYSSGYSSFSVTGGKMKKAKTKQLLLSGIDSPFYTYKEKDTGVKKIVKKTSYLEGRNEADIIGLSDFLSLLHENGIDKETASYFSEISTMEVKYEYINTSDLIVPAGSILLTNEVGQPLADANKPHKKGYRIKCTYLDIDYGSSYLTGLYKKTTASYTLSYEKACDYMNELYGVDLHSMITKEAYDDTLKSQAENCLDTTGATEEMKALAKELSKGCNNDYEICKSIESYLRDYTYTTDATGGYDKSSTMATTEGMADIANRFLFDTKEGYCVHYTASMVMLLRLNNIPARAVMGYRYDFPASRMREYDITSDCAHAWPKAYLSGSGWVPFEPTGAYPVAEVRSWKRGVNESSQTSTAVTSKEQETQTKDSEASAKEKQALRMHLLKVGGIVTGCIILLILLMVLVTIFARKLAYRYATPKKRLKIDVELIKKYLKKSNDIDFCDRGLLYDYVSIAPAEKKDALRKIFDLYYKCQYAVSTTISEEESAFAREIRKGLKK